MRPGVVRHTDTQDHRVWKDDRPERERVGADGRHQDHRILRVAEGASGREVVRGRARRRGDADAVGLDAREMLVVAKELERGHGWAQRGRIDQQRRMRSRGRRRLQSAVDVLGLGPRSTTISFRMTYEPSGTCVRWSSLSSPTNSSMRSPFRCRSGVAPRARDLMIVPSNRRRKLTVMPSRKAESSVSGKRP